MDISITAITRNRKFSKALVRHSKIIEKVSGAASYVNTCMLPFDVMQIVFLDRDKGYARAVGCSGDRLFQVEVSAPNENDIDFSNEAVFTEYVADSLKTAVGLCGLPVEIESQIREEIINAVK